VQEFITTGQGYRLATSTGGVLTGRGADIIVVDHPLKPEEALSDAQRKAANECTAAMKPELEEFGAGGFLDQPRECSLGGLQQPEIVG
jgi:hypothetical protein